MKKHFSLLIVLIVLILPAFCSAGVRYSRSPDTATTTERVFDFYVSWDDYISDTGNDDYSIWWGVGAVDMDGHGYYSECFATSTKAYNFSYILPEQPYQGLWFFGYDTPECSPRWPRVQGSAIEYDGGNVVFEVLSGGTLTANQVLANTFFAFWTIYGSIFYALLGYSFFLTLLISLIYLITRR